MSQPAPYNPAIPQTGNTIADSQFDFLNNFMQLFNAFSEDHVALNAAANAGNHNVIRLVEQKDVQGTVLNELCLYSNKTFEQTDQLYLRFEGNGTNVQYSNYQIYPLAPISQGSNVIQIPYFTFLPGGLILYFGLVNPTGDPFTLVLDPPICVNIVSVNLCPTNSNTTPPSFPSVVAPISNDNVHITGFSLSSSFLFRTPPSQYYMIIGNTKIV